MVSVGKIIKKIREHKGLTASVDNMQASNFSKFESERRDVSVKALDKIAYFYGITVDKIIRFESTLTPASIKVEDKIANEKVQLISQLDEEDKNAVYCISDGMLTKNKFQTFLNKTFKSLNNQIMLAIHPQYITDNTGKKISAVLPMKEFKTLLEELEELEDIRLYDESKNDNEPAIAKNKAMAMIEAERKKLGK